VVQDRDTLQQLGALAKTGPYVRQARWRLSAIQRTLFAVSMEAARSTDDADRGQKESVQIGLALWE
jgi:sigma54-dependent transcription regulator